VNVGDPRLPERFWAKVVVADTGCWLWTAGKFRKGYGCFRVGGRTGKTWGAHAYAYAMLVGPVPDGLVLDHLCRTRLCVNPDHLEPVTHRVNILRGDGPPARNARRVGCMRGHPYSHHNGRQWVCLICNRMRHARRQQARRVA
jgi:hypothetical protein